MTCKRVRPKISDLDSDKLRTRISSRLSSSLILYSRMSCRVPHPALSMLNPMVVPTSNQLVQTKQFGSSTSISTLDSGRGSSMGSRWSSVSSLYSNTSTVSARAKENWQKAKHALKNFPKKLKPKKSEIDKNHALGYNFSYKPLPVEGASPPDRLSICQNQDDFHTNENRIAPDKVLKVNNSDRKPRNKSSGSSSSLKSFQSGEYRIINQSYTMSRSLWVTHLRYNSRILQCE